MNAKPRCFGCNIEAPVTNTEYSLIGDQGWRVSKGVLPDGTMSFEWRCRACWAKYKEGLGRGPSVPPSDPAPRSGPPSERRPPDSAQPSEREPRSSPDSKKPRA